jgi:uncharacterized protein YjeT (DUF2065 family)
VAAAVIYALGLVLVVEGLAFALAPSRIEDALEFLRRMGRDARRLVGLTALAAGIALIGLARLIS